MAGRKTWAVAAAIVALAGMARAERPDGIPSVDEQLRRHGVAKGSAFEKLIRENQDFELLRPGETSPTDRVPAWMKVWWRKEHPEATYSPDDPTGGYPHVLKEILEWMESHQDLRPGNPEQDIPPSWFDFFTSTDGRTALAHSLNPFAASIGTNTRISGAMSASRSESDIRVNYWNTQKIIGASNNISASGFQAQFYSTDGGTTWGQTVLPNPQGDGSDSDPTVDWRSDGSAWSTTLGITGSTLRLRVFKSTDSGATWSYDATPSGSQTNVDKQMMWVDHSGSSTYKDNIYAIWHNGNPVFMSRRNASGWLASPIQVSGSETTGTGIGSDVKSNSFGDVFGMWPDTGSRGIYVVKSVDGGTTYSAPTRITTTYDSYDIGVPSFNGRRILVYVSTGAYRTATKNNVYAIWNDLSGDTGCTAAANEPGSSATSACKTRIWFARSTNGGTGWGTPVKINNQAGKNDQFNPWIAVDETDGRIGVMYYDTVDDAARLKTNVYFQSSTDDGATWSTATKVSTGQTDETSSGADSGNQYGDYNGLTGYAAVFFPSWTDRRSGGKEEIWTAKVTDGTGTPKYSISGSAGTSGVNVSSGASSATSDGSGSYSISNLAAGTYTLTPTKSGCTFTPTTLSVTVGPNATGANFTASCPTYSISGNAGAVSVLLTAGAATATSDASSNYTISNLSAGTYTVVPSKSGCTFAPASLSVTVGPNATGKSFVATCGVASLPESAHNYTNNMDQTWTYTLAGSPSSINVTFDAQTKVETNYDYIYVQDKNGVNITGSPFTSTTLAGATKNVPGDTVKIRLTSDSSVVYYGFKVTAVIAGGTPGDTTAPTTSVTAPANGSTVSGNVTISATASDNVGVTKMEVYVDGALKSSNTGASSIAYTWASTGVANGSHTITSKAYDAASNVGTSSTVTVTVSNTTSSQQLLLNPGFESGATSWTQTTGVIDNGTGQAAHGGSWKAWMNGYGSAHTDSLYQQVTIPASATTATLTFWLHIDSAETTTSTAYDTLKVQVRNSSNTVLATLATYSNLNKATGYTQKSFNLAAYKGQTVRVYFLGVEDSSKQTSFVVDDTALNVQ